MTGMREDMKIVISYMVNGKELGMLYNEERTKKILARLAAILAILLFFSARGTKINRIEKKV